MNFVSKIVLCQIPNLVDEPTSVLVELSVKFYHYLAFELIVHCSFILCFYQRPPPAPQRPRTSTRVKPLNPWLEDLNLNMGIGWHRR